MIGFSGWIDISNQGQSILLYMVSRLIPPLTLILENPESCDRTQLRRDKRYGVLYGDDSPKATTN